MYPHAKALHRADLSGVSLSDDSGGLRVSTDTREILFPERRLYTIHPQRLINAARALLNRQTVRITMLSSWGVKCGIAEYTKSLVDHLPAWCKVTVWDDSRTTHRDLPSIPVGDVVHIQYEPGLWRDKEWLECVLRNFPARIITTHYYDEWMKQTGAKLADVVIVHDKRYAHKARHHYMVHGCPVFA